MDNSEWLNTSIAISKLMEDPCIEDGYLVGECILSLDLLTMLQALKAENHFLDTGKVLKGGVGLPAKLSIEVPRTESVFLDRRGMICWRLVIFYGSRQANTIF